ncbi:two-component regulator propeller domain-containing protein [Robiginitalea sp. SC105]|uniref:hybrid sensor histidine kinase/response regulator transcription factor n=1 Tax=Robiginitalea sp. SC105 TaxID=2762332 RepID=UPI001639E71E|nr:two-component regulator propeller domain-containing protein [Robiginitalea sp. SC105]MBC2840249.1 response regulator [Robiginitalea sp. SC105]
MPLNRFSLLFLLLLAGVFPEIRAQEQISFKQLSIKDGLSQNCGISVAQDSTGFLWIATQDGLNRYDGNEFVKYPFIFSDITRPSFSQLGKVYVDRLGHVWSIPDTGVLHRYLSDTDSFEAYPELSDASVLWQDSDQKYWMGTYNRGLRWFFLMEGELRMGGRIPIESPVYALEESGGLLLAATGEGVVEIYKRTGTIKDTLVLQTNGERIRRGISSILVSDAGRQWYGTYGAGLYYRDKGSDRLEPASARFPDGELPPDLNILSLFQDSAGRIWIGTYGDGLYVLNPESREIQHFSPDKRNHRAIHYNDILSIYEDYTGTLWFGTDGAGLSYYDPYLEKFNSITNAQVPNDINVDVVRAIERDSSGMVWIGTSGKGLMRYNPPEDTWEKFSAANSDLPSDRVMSLFHDGNYLWIGTQGGGLARLDAEGKIVPYTPEGTNSLDAITIWDIFRDSRSRLWLATREYGLVQFDPVQGAVRYFNRNSTPETPVFDNIRVVIEGADGNLWIGGEEEGLIRFNPDNGEFRTFRAGTSPGELPDDKVKSLYMDQDASRLWIGTNGSGISALDLETMQFHTYSVADGLANDVIYAILPDRDGDLWLSSNRGITRFGPPGRWEESPEIENYTNYEGLATEFNTGAAYKYLDGTLYFGGLEGFYWFVPDQIRKNPHLPKTVITGIQVANEPMRMSGNMQLSNREHSLTFIFSSLQFALPDKNEYKYQLLNYDQDWVDAGPINFARYSFLPPGSYEFQVKSSNYDGVWNPTPAVFTFSIAPPWYATLWAKIGYVLLFGLLAWGTYAYFRSRWRMKLNLSLKEAETQRLQRLNEFKSKLYTDISHEIRTPLSLIAAPVEAKLKEGGLSDADYSRYSLINRNTNRIIALVDQMLHLARLEKGKLTLKREKGDPGLFLRVLVKAFEYRADQASVALTWDIGDSGMAGFDADILEKIVSNLLSNAIKYTPAGGACHFGADYPDDQLEIRISNTVRDPETIDPEQLFSRFYQGDDTSEGSGVGLALVRELVSLHEGTIEVALRDFEIHFRVVLPLESAVNKDELPAPPEAQSNPATRAAANGSSKEPSDKPIVLVVEDDAEVREYLRRAWEGRYQVQTAPDGERGLEQAIEQVPDLVLSDIRMPVLGGIELCNRLKTDERTSHIPIILFTSGSGVEQELRGLQSGADDFVTKPFKLAVLEKRIDNLIRIRSALKERYSEQNIFKARDIAVTPTDEAFLRKVQDILDNHLNDATFNAEAFVREVGMSRMQLHRKLQAYTGLSTTAFLRSQRLKQAAELLKTSDLGVSEVAYMVGFNTPSYFIKCFRETYGTTPAEYV